MRDPYSLLGVKKSANADEIKAAWRSKAKSVHPDHNQDDPEATNRFAEMGQAYELLRDPDRRKRYDKAADMHQTIMQQREAQRAEAERAKQARARAEQVMEELARAKAQQAAQSAAQSSSPSQPGPTQPSQTQPGQTQAGPTQAGNASTGQAKAGTDTTKQKNGAASGQQTGQAESAEAMVERIFGFSPGGQSHGSQSQGNHSQANQGQSNHGQGLHASAATGSAEAASGDGAEHDITGEDGRIKTSYTAIDLISTLMRRFRGPATPPEKAPDMFVDVTVTIEDLLKHAVITLHPTEDREARLKLEAGMTDGHVARLKGQGLKIPGMKTGDLVATLKVANDARFRVARFDIHAVLPISLEDAVLGGELPIDTPEGEKTVSVPPWSGSDRSIRMEGLGLADETGKRGDLIAEPRIMLHETPDPKVTDLMRHMRHGLFL